jgi:hypothetical protein
MSIEIIKPFANDEQRRRCYAQAERDKKEGKNPRGTAKNLNTEKPERKSPEIPKSPTVFDSVKNFWKKNANVFRTK